MEPTEEKENWTPFQFSDDWGKFKGLICSKFYKQGDHDKGFFLLKICIIVI